MYFAKNIDKFLRAPTLKNICDGLLLTVQNENQTIWILKKYDRFSMDK